jgi:hypothetical protein
MHLTKLQKYIFVSVCVAFFGWYVQKWIEGGN